MTLYPKAVQTYVVVGRKKHSAFHVNGELVTLADMAMRAGCGRTTVIQRLKRGATPEEACVPLEREPPPKMLTRQEAAVEGEQRAITRLRSEGRLKAFFRLRNLYRRMEYGLTLEEAFAEALRLFPPLTEQDARRQVELRNKGRTPDGETRGASQHRAEDQASGA